MSPTRWTGPARIAGSSTCCSPTPRRCCFIHCTAGKDRTGFGAALLLTALGVPYKAVRADYLATNRLWQPDPAVVGRFPPGVADVLLRTHPQLLDAAFAAAAEECGSMDGYLERRIRLADEARTRLRALLLA